MTALDLLIRLHALRVDLTPAPDGSLHYEAPKGTMTPALLEGMHQHKDSLLNLLEEYEERAGMLEYCGGMPRHEAEALAWRLLLAGHMTLVD